jgi:hypothetical protein
MTHRLTWVLVTLLGTGFVVAACSSDNADGMNGGSAGEANGGETASNGGSAAGKAGASNGGTAQGGNAGMDQGGAGQNAGGIGVELGGAAGAAGAVTLAGGAGEMAGAAGAPDGAAGAPAIDYACTATTWAHKLCSAEVAMNCSTPTDCSDCVMYRTTERQAFENCSACTAEYDRYIQCGIDAFESHQLDMAFACYDPDGADLNDYCYPILDSLMKCEDYATANEACPTTWPVN